MYILWSDKCKKTWNGFSSQAFSGLWDFSKLSAASSVMLCLEIWYFQILVLVAGLLPNPEVALDSLAVCNTILGWVFMIPDGFTAAARGGKVLWHTLTWDVTTLLVFHWVFFMAFTSNSKLRDYGCSCLEEQPCKLLSYYGPLLEPIGTKRWRKRKID